MDTALLAKVQRAFIRRGLLGDDYEPGVWDVPTARAYVSYMRSRSILRYPQQINLKDTALVREILTVLSNKLPESTSEEPAEQLVAINASSSREQARPDPTAGWIDGVLAADTPPSPAAQEAAGEAIPVQPAPMAPEVAKATPTAQAGLDSSTLATLAAIRSQLKK